jgi:shikimate kinase
MKKIVLTGYMGSGKTTIGRLLARATALPHIDLDEYIEQKEQQSVPEIFNIKGEIYFRKTEHSALKELLKRDEDIIVSTGGGTPCYANNHEMLNCNGVISVYLKASIDELHRRLKAQGLKSRPLLAGLPEEEREEYIAKHLFDRSYFYMQATHVVDTTVKSPEDVVNEIISLF